MGREEPAVQRLLRHDGEWWRLDARRHDAEFQLGVRLLFDTLDELHHPQRGRARSGHRCGHEEHGLQHRRSHEHPLLSGLTDELPRPSQVRHIRVGALRARPSTSASAARPSCRGTPRADSPYSSEPYCNVSGFNLAPAGTYFAQCRFGLIMNNENDCDSPDASIGFGCYRGFDGASVGAGSFVYAPSAT